MEASVQGWNLGRGKGIKGSLYRPHTSTSSPPLLRNTSAGLLQEAMPSRTLWLQSTAQEQHVHIVATINS